MISPERLDQRQAGFARLVGSYGVSPAAAYDVLDRLVAAYSEPHRHYHTLRHIDEILRTAGKLRDYAVDPQAIELAIWFHDVVYDPHRQDNEQRSADWARSHLSTLGLPETTISAVVDLILTTTHVVADVSRDAAVLLDADLAIFGATPERYREYARDIRREYDWVSDADYRTGRQTVLQSFLRRNRIYRTERMHLAGDAAARQNLQTEIDDLAAGPPN